MILCESVSLFTFKKSSYGIPHILFKIMLKPNRLSQSYEIFHEEMIGHVLLGKFNLNFQKCIL